MGTGLLLLLACLASNELLAQTRQVKDRVTDDSDLPLQGANVQLAEILAKIVHL